MVKAGCITFVPNEGRQVEIVDHLLLTYDSVDNAVEKIDAVFTQPQLQADMRGHLEWQAEQFSVARFMDGARKAVEAMLQSTKNYRETRERQT